MASLFQTSQELNESIFKRKAEKSALEAIKRSRVSLNIVNNYRENIVHVSASNDCCEIINELLKSETLVKKADAKNKFGWTPLMQALRNGHLEATKILLSHGFSPKQSNYLGTSTLAIAAGVGRAAFETIFLASPESVQETSEDDVSPICVAALANDKGLIMRLARLGVDASKANDYALFMMSRSSDPEIQKLGKPLCTMNFWSDDSDNIDVSEDQMIEIAEKFAEETYESNPKKIVLPKIVLRQPSDANVLFSPSKKNLQALHISNDTMRNVPRQSVISPTLVYNRQESFAMSPNICFKLKSQEQGQLEDPSTPRTKTNSESWKDVEEVSCGALDNTLGFSPEYDPFSSPNVPIRLQEEAYGEDTPTPPHCKTPPSGVVLSSFQTELANVLRTHGLGRCISLLLEQEVDFELFLSLGDDDLREIGITSQADREHLLKIARDCKAN